MKEVEILKVTKKIDNVKEKVLDLYYKNDLIEAKENLENEQNEIGKNEEIVIAFIGQYSAGKSTIISALTNNRDIKIDANVATEVAQRYKWSDQITLVDTPGLYTENTDHDMRTKEAINKSDILVYCITNELFDEITIEDYKSWGYEKDYKNKMFIIINKMSRETGDYDELKNNYIESINRALNPYRIEDVEHSFVDAKDYIEGIDENDPDFINFSKFEDFIEKLNIFTKDKGLTSRLDTPIKSIINSIHLVLSDYLNEDKDKHFIKLIDSVYKKVDFRSAQIIKRSSIIIDEKLAGFLSYGNGIAQTIGTEGFQFNEKEFNSKLKDTGLQIDIKISEMLEEENKSLEEEVSQVLESDLATIYLRDLSGTPEFKDIDLGSGSNTSNFFKVFDIAKKNNVDKFTMKYGLPLGMKPGQVSGNKIHEGVKFIGNKLNYKFVPWEAVNIAKNIGKALGIAGVVLQIGSLIHNVTDDKEQEEFNRLMNARGEFRTSISNIVDEMEKEHKKALKDITKDYQDILNNINDLKNERLEKINTSERFVGELKLEIDKLMEIQDTLIG